MSCLRYWKCHQVEEVNYLIVRLQLWHKLPQFQEPASRKWKHTDPGTEDYLCLKQPCWSGHQWPISRWWSKLTVLFLHVPPAPRPFCLLKALSPDCREEESAFGQECTLSLAPSLPVAGIQNKANFPFHQSGLFIGFWAESSWTWVP